MILISFQPQSQFWGSLCKYTVNSTIRTKYRHITFGLGRCRDVSKAQPQTIQIDLYQPLGAISAAHLAGSCAFSADEPPPSISFLSQQTDLYYVKIMSSISLSFPFFLFWDRNHFHKLYKSNCYNISLAWPIGWNHLQGIFRDHLILCVLSWADFQGISLSPLSVCHQCVLTQTSRMYFSLDSQLLQVSAGRFTYDPENRPKTTTHNQTLIL